MYQFSKRVQDFNGGFDSVINDLKEQLSSFSNDHLLFHIYSSVFALETISDLICELRDQFPGCQIVFATTSGAVLDYEYQTGIIISVGAFEHHDSRFEVRSYDLTVTSEKAAAEKIVQFVQEHSWVKAIELCRTTHDFDVVDICSILSGLPEDIVVFGGISVPEVAVVDKLSYVADQSGKIMDQGGVITYYGGSDLHIQTYSMSGWKPIDREFTVTKSEGPVVKELDDAPANHIFKHYLDIDDDPATFKENSLEFPLLCKDHGWTLMRNVFDLDTDGGLMMATHLQPGAKVRVCFADTSSIVEGINNISKDVMQFTPDAISIVSCITRDIIWHMKDYVSELTGFKSVAPCHGFLAHGELIRENGLLALQNTQLVVAAFREGDLKDVSYPEVSLSPGSVQPLTARLSTFLSRVTAELQEMYFKVEKIAKTDALTGIGNRYLFDVVVDSAALDTLHADTKYLLMFDMNGLKYVNDTFGHIAGDAIIDAAAKTIEKVFSPYGQCFRIGGDEFAVIADFESDAALQKALKDFQNSVCEYNKAASNYTLSMAAGYAPLIDADGKLLSSTEWRTAADINMYKDKERFHVAHPGF